MSQPVVSICIPTYNRARYLRCLLEDIGANAGALKHAYEIVISDNASTDDTQSMVGEFKGKLPIRYIRRDKNYGGDNNAMYVKTLALGTFQLYVADDDTLIFPAVNSVIDRMLADASLGVVFAPWKIHDRVENKYLGNFYPLEKEFSIERGQYGVLLSLILTNHVFPEIYIIRSDVLRAASVFTHPLAYWAFVQAAEYLSFAKVLFSPEPFYTTITRYFADEGTRGQAGHAETQEHWDRYRGGLEYIVSRTPNLTQEQLGSALGKIHQFTARQMHMALKMRIAAKRDPIDNYYLACRLRGMGFPELLPLPFDSIRGMAVVHHLSSGQGIEKILCVGAVNKPLRDLLGKAAALPIEDIQSFSPETHRNAAVLIAGSARTRALDQALLIERNLRVYGDADLMQKFA